MRSKWIAVIVAAGVIGGMAWSTSKPTQAAMVAGGASASAGRPWRIAPA